MYMTKFSTKLTEPRRDMKKVICYNLFEQIVTNNFFSCLAGAPYVNAYKCAKFQVPSSISYGDMEGVPE